MKISFTHKSALLLIPFLASRLSKTAILSNDLISDVCQKPSNPLCTKIIKSDGRARKALSIRVLGEIALDKAINCTDSTDKLLQSLQRITRNRQLIMGQKYENCWEYYAFIYNYLDQAKRDFRCNDFGDGRKNIGAVLKEVYGCQKQFQGYFVEVKKLKTYKTRFKTYTRTYKTF